MFNRIGSFLVLVGLGACTESPVSPAHSTQPTLALSSANNCPANPDIVVSDNAGLQQAANTARPGSTIAIRGTIVETGDVDVPTDGLTFTCATPGSGLAAAPGVGINWLLVVRSRGVTVQGLALDAREALDGATLAVNDPDENAVAGAFRFLDNQVSCGPGQCLFIVSARFGAGRIAFVARNQFVASGAATGPQIQNFQDVTLEGNTVLANTPSGIGIMVNSGLHINAILNQVLGPWGTSVLYVDGVSESTAANNRLTGASIYGMRLGDTGRVQIVNNQIASTGTAAVFVAGSCFDTFVQNSFLGTTGSTVFFAVDTGANLFVGASLGVVDTGNIDCDGDGIVDPNRILGV